ncbi:MAG: hypothetical protein ACFFEM_07840, partial [Candidatus Thorarchaeota archaeon]
MIQILEISALLANIAAIGIPVVLLCLFLLLIPSLSDGSKSKARRYLSYLVKPPKLSLESREEPSSREDKIRIFFYYLGILLFLIGFMIGELYEVVLDLALPVTQGSTGEMRDIVSV